MKKDRADWESYAETRLLGRNRLLLEHHQEALRDFLDYFSRLPADTHIFDIGCSAGFFLVILRELGFSNIEGADISQTYVSYAVTKGLRCRTANVLDDHVAEETGNAADVVLLMDVLEHLPDPAKALDNCKKVLKQGGLLYITVPIYDSLTERLIRVVRGKTRLRQAQEHDPTHVHAFTEKGVYGLLKQCGFVAVESRRLFCPIPMIPGRRVRDTINVLLPDFWKGKFLRVAARQVETKRC